MTVGNMTPQQFENYRRTILQNESGGKYNTPANDYGYVGGYQMGTMALKEAGLIRLDAPNSNSSINNPANWRTPPGNLQNFLNNPQIQDQAFDKFTKKNYSYLKTFRVINDSTPAGDQAGYLAASHLLGASDVSKKGLNAADANGTKGSKYFADAKGSVLGLPGSPPPVTATGANAAAGGSSVPGSPNAGTAGSPILEQSDLPKVRAGTPPVPVQPIPNPLGKFSSFNCIITLSAMDKEELNNPDGTYATGSTPKHIILKSGGGQPDNRIQTDSGKFEYYIDNFEMKGMVAFDPKIQNTNASGFRFDVVEPYSMGTFLESLQLASTAAGQGNYAQSPFLITVEFIGFDERGAAFNVPQTTRYLPIQFRSIEMEITASGSKYSCTAIPFNQIALGDVTQKLKTEITITGDTVQEMLQSGTNSLQVMLNNNLKEIAEKSNKDKKLIPDQLLILFPETLQSSATARGTGFLDRGATTQSANASSGVQTKLGVNRGENQSLIQSSGGANLIGQSKMGFTMSTGGNPPAPRDNEVAQEGGVFQRNKVNIDPTKREFVFAQNSTITNAITQVVIMSDFGRALSTQTQDEKDMLTWFKIETQVYDLDRDETTFGLKGRDPRLFVYSVVPYKIHASNFMPATARVGYDALAGQTLKRYKYIYTGENTEILDLQIKLNYAFFSTTGPDASGAGNGDARTSAQSSAGGAAPTTPLTPQPGSGDPQTATTTGRNENVVVSSSHSGGGAADDHLTVVAKRFQEQLYNSSSQLVQIEPLVIMGDPYYIADSGVGNFSNSGTGSFNITATGAMDYQNGEVDILLDFRNPVDINPETGILDSGQSTVVKEFTGVYRVIEITSMIQGNKFTQALKLMRRPNQDGTFGRPVTSTNRVAVGNQRTADEAQARADSTTSSSGVVAAPERIRQLDNSGEGDGSLYGD